MPVGWEQLVAHARAEVQRTIRTLPPPLREAASTLPLICESIPSADWQADGVEADTLGLFVGPEYSDLHSAGVPAQIVLYLENIWEMVDADEAEFRREVRTTYLHELGHYLGLDEIDLDERGLG